ncbi:hypothetical protein PGQ11_002548 [Apiospora arundinis]|uniref:Uncharacterized protein n=1 Tax=Apiospora arundinis TaxID=335852 RepID=A0ABR2JIH0_9PEZI
MTSTYPKPLHFPNENDDEEEDEAPVNTLDALSRVDQALSDADAKFEEFLLQAIQTYKAYRKQCDDLISQRTSIIGDLSSSDPISAARYTGTNLDIPAVLFQEYGVLCSFKPVPKHPASPEPTLARDKYPCEPKSITISASSSNPTEPPNPRQQSRAARTAKHTAAIDEPHQPQPSRVLRGKRPAAEADLAAAPAVAAPPPSKRLHKLPQPQRQQYETIKTDLVTKEHYWVFDFGYDPASLYTLRCPSSTCNNPVFSKHPLLEERAARHFKSCGVNFRNTTDLVRRYARLVVSGRKGREVKRAWAKAHNLRLLAGDEAHLACENLD